MTIAPSTAPASTTRQNSTREHHIRGRTTKRSYSSSTRYFSSSSFWNPVSAGARSAGTSAAGSSFTHAHIAIDDASRLAYAEVLANEHGDTSAAFLQRAVAWFRRHDIRIQGVLTDNGSGYVSACFALACTRLKIQHLRTRPYRPQTNGKAERFIQTCLREWAYAEAYPTSQQRTAALAHWLHHYNWHRPHQGIGGATPMSRLTTSRNNLLTLHN